MDYYAAFSVDDNGKEVGIGISRDGLLLMTSVISLADFDITKNNYDSYLKSHLYSLRCKAGHSLGAGRYIIKRVSILELGYVGS
jgi:hypothetical protein